MPAIASDRLVDLHNDLTDYDVMVTTQVGKFLRGNLIHCHNVQLDLELDQALRTFKPETPSESECRRELLRYKRRIDDLARELSRTLDGKGFPALNGNGTNHDEDDEG